MQVRKEKLNITENVYEGEIKTTADGNIIVPDVKPDILKILQVDAESFLCEKIIDSGKITLKGKVNVNILYVPENEDCVQCLQGAFEFCETLKRNEFSQNMQLVAFCDVDSASYRLINSRKVGIDVGVTIDVQVIGIREIEIVGEVEDENARLRKESINFCKTEVCREFNFDISETINLPQEKQCAEEILKCNITMSDKEYKALGGKLAVKGRINAAVLYRDEKNQCAHTEIESPFTEVFDIDEITEDSECEIIYQIGDIKTKLIPDLSGDIKNISIEADVSVCVKVENESCISALSDCYFINAGCDLSFNEVATEEISDRPVYSAVLKELLKTKEGAPRIEEVYSVVAKPYITDIKVQNGRLAVSGKCIIYVLYITDDIKEPVGSINEEVPFAYVVDCENALPKTVATLSCECENVSYTLNSADVVDVRCGINIRGKVVKKSTSKVISNIEECEMEKINSGIVIYFVKEGDDIWSIAKRYHTGDDLILQYNNIGEDDCPSVGDKLIIPIV